jgi:membrane protease YdiL (CAAX protease family)
MHRDFVSLCLVTAEKFPAGDNDQSTSLGFGGALIFLAVAGFIVGQITALVAVALTARAVGDRHGLGDLLAHQLPGWGIAATLIGEWCGFAMAIWFAHRRRGLFPVGAWKVRRNDLQFFAMGVGLQILVDLAYAPFHLRHLNDPVTALFGGAHGALFAAIALGTAVGAPVAEELLFRWVLLQGVRRVVTSWGSARRQMLITIVVSGLLFGLAHGEMLQLPALAVSGIIFGYVTLRTSRVAPSILMHAGFNSLAVMALVWSRHHG